MLRNFSKYQTLPRIKWKNVSLVLRSQKTLAYTFSELGKFSLAHQRYFFGFLLQIKFTLNGIYFDATNYREPCYQSSEGKLCHVKLFKMFTNYLE